MLRLAWNLLLCWEGTCSSGLQERLSHLGLRDSTMAALHPLSERALTGFSTDSIVYFVE